jgi:hypothetical protein
MNDTPGLIDQEAIVTLIPELAARLDTLSTRAELFQEANFAARCETLDELEFPIIACLQDLTQSHPSPAVTRLVRQARALQRQLAALDQCLFYQLQGLIRTGQSTPATLRAILGGYAGQACCEDASTATEYDCLDALTDGLFLTPGPLRETLVPEPEMMYYQKTPARIIWELAAKVTAGDVFYDLGSGLGQVPMLVQLLSGATAKGVEIEPAYCRYAQACADELRLTRVEFLNADARAVDYTDGTVFFVFTSFTGRLMQQVLARLWQVAQQKPLKLFSYGPGTETIARQPWLRRLNPADSHRYQLAEFRSDPTQALKAMTLQE